MIRITKRLILILATLLLLLWQALPDYTLYVWFHLPALNKLADTIMAQDSIESLELGNDGCAEFGRGEPDECFDTYRFLNGDEVTHYLEQAHSGTAYIETYLAEHNIPAALYYDLHQQMKRLGIKVFYKEPEIHGIVFIKPGQYHVLGQGECIAYSSKASFYYPFSHWVAPNWRVAIYD